MIEDRSVIRHLVRNFIKSTHYTVSVLGSSVLHSPNQEKEFSFNQAHLVCRTCLVTRVQPKERVQIRSNSRDIFEKVDLLQKVETKASKEEFVIRSKFHWYGQVLRNE